MIECSNLTHYYGKRLIFENLSFEVPKGRILGLLGKNGTGKTTTINILNGFLKPHSGECRVFGEKVQQMPAYMRQNIGMLIEGHIQYAFMTIEQIEKFYASFYPRWKKEAYYELLKKLQVAPQQRISHMSCGQRSQVALGLILAQNPELLILDDFSLGLDPGYRRLFSDYLRDFAKSEQKTVFLTSHIIQDMERLVDDCIIMDYGKILTQQPVKKLLNAYRTYKFNVSSDFEFNSPELYHPTQIRDEVEMGSFLVFDEMRQLLDSNGVFYQNLTAQQVSLEDAFIGLTGKY